MVSLTENIIRLRDVTYKIDRFEVWFVTPSGLATTREEAVAVCSSLNCPANMNINAVAVAIAQGVENVYEVL